MQSVPESGSTPSPSWTQRVFGRWWRSQSPSRQDRFATLGPLVSVLLFLAAIVAAFWTLRNEEIERATDAVRRDTEVEAADPLPPQRGPGTDGAPDA